MYNYITTYKNDYYWPRNFYHPYKYVFEDRQNVDLDNYLYNKIDGLNLIDEPTYKRYKYDTPIYDVYNDEDLTKYHGECCCCCYCERKAMESVTYQKPKEKSFLETYLTVPGEKFVPRNIDLNKLGESEYKDNISKLGGKILNKEKAKQRERESKKRRALKTCCDQKCGKC